ncbi:MAG TPA: inorganic diphosphatase [Verrucomicrobiae bacterium]
MTMDFETLPTRSRNGAIHVVVESPGGSRVKLKYEPSLRAFKLSRPLTTGLVYPYDWGFIPSTTAADGDPLDAMVFSDVSTYPGVVIECRTLGVLRLEQNGKQKKRERNDRLIVVPIKLPRFNSFKTPEDLPERWRSELEEFFVNVTRFENKDPKLLGWAGPEEGDRMVRDCVRGAKNC